MESAHKPGLVSFGLALLLVAGVSYGGLASSATEHGLEGARLGPAQIEEGERTPCLGNDCGFIRNGDLKNYCRGDCGFIRNADFKNFCRKDCSFIKNSDLKNYCRKDCSFIKNSDMKNYCRGDCSFIRNADLKNLCRSKRPWPGPR